jgi:hypothetical protein
MRWLLHPRRLAALALVGVMGLASVASSTTLWRCTMRAGLMRACCCPSEAAQDPAPRPTIERASCCEADSVDLIRPPSEAPSRLDLLAPPSTGVAVVEAVPPRSARPPFLAAAPPRGPPLLLVKHSRLI